MSKPSIKIDKICKHCGISFKVYPSNLRQTPRYFCSKKCEVIDKKGKSYEELYGFEKAEIERQKRSKSLSNYIKTKEHRDNISKGLLTSEDFKQAIKIRPLNKEKLSKSVTLSYINNPQLRELRSRTSKDAWTLERQSKMVRSRSQKKLSSYETKVLEVIKKSNFPFIFTGHGSFWMKYTNPDFAHNRYPILIEVFNSYTHNILWRRYSGDYEKSRFRIHEQEGYFTIFINEEQCKGAIYFTKIYNKIQLGLREAVARGYTCTNQNLKK